MLKYIRGVDEKAAEKEESQKAAVSPRLGWGDVVSRIMAHRSVREHQGVVADLIADDPILQADTRRPSAPAQQEGATARPQSPAVRLRNAVVRARRYYLKDPPTSLQPKPPRQQLDGRRRSFPSSKAALAALSPKSFARWRWAINSAKDAAAVASTADGSTAVSSAPTTTMAAAEATTLEAI